ncbi:MAG: 3'(2'),5'-bisphosphate nucleotidase CysQ [Acidimicrobiaceae bacterium]|nr:3'(2'),5'-bisphosphate nucleotidase CysQ [Acidimicrobiaceae bacterium]
MAREAGELLLGLRAQLGARGIDGPDLGSQGDRRAHELLAQRLAAARPGDAVLSEEGDDDGSRLGAERVWVIDPLDGTDQYCWPPRADWAVHVALVIDHRPVAAAVALPALGRLFSTADPPAAPERRDGPARMVVSRNGPSWQACVVADALDAEMIPLGSAGAKAMAVVSGAADAYVHAGGQYEWDSCAPAAVAESAGLATSRIDGSPLRYNQPDPYLPDLVICRPELAEAVLHALR